MNFDILDIMNAPRGIPISIKGYFQVKVHTMQDPDIFKQFEVLIVPSDIPQYGLIKSNINENLTSVSGIIKTFQII